MDCEQAQRLFDSYLDGQLSPALTTELGAHRLRCPECRRALALLEVSGHILATDPEPDELPRDFTDRLLACVDDSARGWAIRARRFLYVGVPAAAAAMVALAFLGLFDRQPGEAAGKKELAPASVQISAIDDSERPTAASTNDGTDAPSVDEQLLGEWLERTREHIAAKEQAGESLQRMMDMTILQLLDVLQQAQESVDGPRVLPDSAQPSPTGPRKPDAPKTDRDTEDM